MWSIYTYKVHVDDYIPTVILFIDIEISETNEYSPLVYNQNIHFIIINRFGNGHYISRCVYNLMRFEFIVLPCKTTFSYSRYFFPGHYSSGGATSCSQCTAGHFCTSTTQTACGATKYSSAGATSCSDCPAGYQCPNSTTSTPTKCLAGTYSGPAAASCTDCDKGYQCPLDGATAPEPCGNGTYAPNTSATTCTPCPGGMFYVYQ